MEVPKPVKRCKKKPKVGTKAYGKERIKVWVEYLDKLWRMAIHLSSDDCCWTPCPSKKPKEEKVYNAHHCFTRKRMSTRWDVDNGFRLCYYCHEVRLKEDAEGFRRQAIKILGKRYSEESGETTYDIVYRKSLELFTDTSDDVFINIERDIIRRICLMVSDVQLLDFPKKPRKLECV